MNLQPNFIEIRYREVGDSDLSWFFVKVPHRLNNYTIQDLKEDTEYETQARNCYLTESGEETSDWTPIQRFRTLPKERNSNMDFRIF